MTSTTYIAKQVRFIGTVQGVGFRYTARNRAAQFKVTGYVMNLPNGDVDMLVQGFAENVDLAIDAIKQDFADFLEKVQVNETPADDRYTSFVIKY